MPVLNVLFLCFRQRCLGGAIISAGARLTELDLSDNAFGPDGVKGIEQLLKSPSCHTLRELKLNNCGMGIGGGKVSSQTAMLNALICFDLTLSTPHAAPNRRLQILLLYSNQTN